MSACTCAHAEINTRLTGSQSNETATANRPRLDGIGSAGLGGYCGGLGLDPAQTACRCLARPREPEETGLETGHCSPGPQLIGLAVNCANSCCSVQSANIS